MGQAEAMKPAPDYVEPTAVFIHSHVRRPSFRDFEPVSLQRPSWFMKLGPDADFEG